MDSLIPHYDPNFVIPATDEIVRHMKAWRDELDQRLSTTDYSAFPDGSHYYGEDFYASVYGDAAFSQAVTGVVAPLLEGAICQEFRSIQQLSHLATWNQDHHRWRLDPHDYWDPHSLSFKGQKCELPNFTAGVSQLIKASHIQAFLPAVLPRVLGALFAFRNKAMHLGLEWPPDERQSFADQIVQEGWGDWFAWARREGEPWIASMTDAFLATIRTTTHDTVRGFDTLRETILTHKAAFGKG